MSTLNLKCLEIWFKIRVLLDLPLSDQSFLSTVFFPLIPSGFSHWYFFLHFNSYAQSYLIHSFALYLQYHQLFSCKQHFNSHLSLLSGRKDLWLLNTSFPPYSSAVAELSIEHNGWNDDVWHISIYENQAVYIKERETLQAETSWENSKRWVKNDYSNKFYVAPFFQCISH